MFRPASPEKEHWLRQRLEEWNIPVPTYQLTECLFRQVMARGGAGKFRYEGEDKIPILDDPIAGAQRKVEALLQHIADWQCDPARRDIAFGFHSFTFSEVERDKETVGTFNKFRKRILVIQRKMGDQSLHGPRTWIGEKKAQVLKEVRRSPGYVESAGDDLAIREFVHPYYSCYLAYGSAVFGRIMGSDVTKLLVEKLKLEHAVPGRENPFNKEWADDRLRKTKGLQKMTDFPTDSGLVSDELSDAIIATGQTLSL